MQGPNHHIDQLFQKDLMTHEVTVTDRDNLWSRIRPEKRAYKGLLLFAFGLVGVLGAIYTTSPVDYSSGGGGAKASLIDIVAADTDEDRSQHLVQLLEETKEKSDGSDTVIKEGVDMGLKSPVQTEDTSDEPPIANLNYLVVSEDNGIQVDHNDQLENSTNQVPGYFDNMFVMPEDTDDELADQSKLLENENDPAIIIKDDTPKNQRLLVASAAAMPSLLSMLQVTEREPETSPLFELPNQKNKLACDFSRDQRLYLDLYGALALPIEQVSLNAGYTDLTTYRDEWSTRYKPVSSITGGVAIGYQLTPKIDVSLGLEYQRVETQYRTTQTVTEIIRVFDPMAYFYYDDMGDVVWVADSVTAVSQYDRTTSLPNTTQLFSTPLQVSYTIGQRAPWNIKLSTAGIFNWAINQRGQYLREDLTLIPVDSANDVFFVRPRINVSVELGMHLGYFVEERLEVYASPRFRYNPTSYHPTNAPLSLTRSFLGLRAGMQYHF